MENETEVTGLFIVSSHDGTVQFIVKAENEAQANTAIGSTGNPARPIILTNGVYGPVN